MSAPSLAFVQVSSDPAAWARIAAIVAVYALSNGVVRVKVGDGIILTADCGVDEFMQRLNGGGRS